MSGTNGNPFDRELCALLNKHGVDNTLEIPDYILTDYIRDCLGAAQPLASKKPDKLSTLAAHNAAADALVVRLRKHRTGV